MKNIKKIIFLLIMIFMTTSCVKDETTLTVNSDKSVNLTVNVGYSITSDKTLTIEEVKQKVSSLGFNVDSYHDDKYVGYSLSKNYENINDISGSEETNINFADIVNGKFDDSKLFRVKKGFFKNTYYANYTYDFRNIYEYKDTVYFYGEDGMEISDNLKQFISEKLESNSSLELESYNVVSNEENLNALKAKLESMGIEYIGIPVVIIGENVFVGNTDEERNNIENCINNYQLNLPEHVLTFKVNLPSGSISDNATKVEGNTLIWNADYLKENNIEFSFSVFKPASIVILIIILLLLAGGGFVGFIFYKKMLDQKRKFIAKNNDISNIIPETDTEHNKIMSINDLMK